MREKEVKEGMATDTWSVCRPSPGQKRAKKKPETMTVLYFWYLSHVLWKEDIKSKKLDKTVHTDTGTVHTAPRTYGVIRTALLSAPAELLQSVLCPYNISSILHFQQRKLRPRLEHKKNEKSRFYIRLVSFFLLTLL